MQRASFAARLDSGVRHDQANRYAVAPGNSGINIYRLALHLITEAFFLTIITGIAVISAAVLIIIAMPS